MFVVSLWITSNTPEQLSINSGVGVGGISEQITSISVSNGVTIVGAAVSETVIVCEWVTLLLQSSVAVHVLIITYCPAQFELLVSILSATEINTSLSQLSEAVKVCASGIASHETLIFAGNSLVKVGAGYTNLASS